MSDDYPIAVERLNASQAKRLVCPNCAEERDATGDEVGLVDGLPKCGVCGKGWLEWKYMEGDKCPGCGKLGWWTVNYPTRACSRVCHLQAEYAKTLEERKKFRAVAQGGKP